MSATLLNTIQVERYAVKHTSWRQSSRRRRVRLAMQRRDSFGINKAFVISFEERVLIKALRDAGYHVYVPDEDGAK